LLDLRLVRVEQQSRRLSLGKNPQTPVAKTVGAFSEALFIDNPYILDIQNEAGGSSKVPPPSNPDLSANGTAATVKLLHICLLARPGCQFKPEGRVLRL
jgi:hypothetical protein